jgi:hypothetical protein
MNDDLMKELEMNNWNENGSEFHVFNSEEELCSYLHRSESGKWWREEYGRFDFEQCIFNFDVKLWVNEFDSRACFKNAIFKESVSFKDLTFKHVADFNGCTFKKMTSFSGAVFEDDANMCSFDGDVSFHKAKFKANTYFWNHFVGEADFSYCRFKNPTDFSNCLFDKDVKFHDSVFETDAFFNESEFKGKLNGWKITFKLNVTFKWTDFRKKANLSQLSAENGYVELHGSNFEQNAYFYDSKINSLDLRKSVIDKGLFFLGAEINMKERETCRIIKNEFQKQNNRIEGLKYHALEMREYEKELFGNKKHLRFAFLRFLRDFIHVFKGSNKGDKFTLFINRISNGYNVNPLRGVGFTLISTFLSYLAFIYVVKYENELQFDYSFEHLAVNIKQLLQMLNVTNWKYYPFGYDYNLAYAILFVGRIIIGYGIYQTVQAFRKYGKL